MDTILQTNRICPHLGLMDDADTTLAFPSVWNACYLSQPLAAPKLKYQGEFCLCENYRACPVFLRQRVSSLPEHISTPQTLLPRRFFRRNLTIAVLALGIILVLAWEIMNGNFFTPIATRRTDQTTLILGTPSVTKTSSLIETFSEPPSFYNQRLDSYTLK